jgi:hypothetical protein
MNGKVRQVDGRLPRPARLIFGRNELRRPCDRIEGAILLTVSAAFLTVLALAALLAGHIYNSQRAAAARLQPTVAILSEPGPAVANALNPTAPVQAQATWRLADGAKRSGLLTASTAPAIDDAWAGSTVPVWLNRSGDPQPPPPAQDEIVADALTAGAVLATGAGALLAFCYWLARRALDRHRLTRWEQAWAVTGPRWTSRH